MKARTSTKPSESTSSRNTAPAKSSARNRKSEGKKDKYLVIRRDLERQRTAILEEAGEVLTHRESNIETFPDVSDQASAEIDQNFSMRIRDRERKLLKKIEEALDRMNSLHTSHAFHSPMMEPVLEPFTALLRQVKMSAPAIPYVSNVTGRWVTAREAQSPEYWAGHVRQTVRFSDGVAELVKDSRQVLLEIGPGQTLCTLSRQHPNKQADQQIFASLPQAGEQELRGLTETLGRLWMVGVAVDWEGYYANERRSRTVLPTYSFERKRYWPDPPAQPNSMMTTAVSLPVQGGSTPGPVATVESRPIRSDQTVQPTPVGGTVSRKDRLLEEVRHLMQELSGYDFSGVEPTTDLLELGLDSLLLTQASQLIQRKFGVQVSFRQLMEELSSLGAIAAHVDACMSPEATPSKSTTPVAVSSPALVTAESSGSNTVPHSILEQILQQQQLLTNQVLQLMGRQPVAVSAPTVPAVSLVSPAPGGGVAPSVSKSHGPFKPFDRHASTALSDTQKQALDRLIATYTARTAGSKKLSGAHRTILADPRSVAGFNRLWKEMVYPIVSTKSNGSRIWDVDGNEYIDFVMGFGASLFGHRPSFVVDAMHKQLDIGFEIGPIQPLVYDVAMLMKEFTGMPRCAFTNTGSEAVLGATRVARTVTGRDKIAVFAGAYHGIFDEVLFRPLTVNGELRTAAIAPGIPDSALTQVIVLDYGNPQSLEILRARGREIAAVLVEPVQSRRLDLQPKEFLHELRRITQETGTALIFDEIVMGFRAHPGGAQGYFGIRADLATYGKVIGGGVSIGVVAGDARYMDALDGGQWQYGDASFPEVGVTFFAGTFVRHPLALAAVKAVLTHLKERGPELQKQLAERTAVLANELRAAIVEFKAPYQVTQFSSLIQVSYPSEQKLAGLLFYLLRARGIHIFENRAFVMTTAHSESDLAKLVAAFRESLAEMQMSSFIIGSTEEVKTGAHKEETVQRDSVAGRLVSRVPANRFPLTEAQKEIWLAAQMGGEASIAYNESLTLRFSGPFDIKTFKEAVGEVVRRHPIVLASISEDGEWQRIPTDLKIEIPLEDMSAQSDTEQDRYVAETIHHEATGHFDLSVGPLLRVRVIRLRDDRHVVLWTAHHIVCDGWSGGVLISEMAKIYSARKQGASLQLDVPVPFQDYVQQAQPDSRLAQDALAYWREQFAVVPLPLDLPTDRSRPVVRSAKAATVTRRFDSALYQSLKRLAGQQRTTMVVLLMAAIKTLLQRLTGQTDLVIGLPVAGQAVTGNHCLVGHCVNLLPIRVRLRQESGFLDNLAAVKKQVLDAYDHHQCTIGTILQHVAVSRHASRPPLVEVIFNVDRDLSGTEFSGLSFTCERNHKPALHYDFFFNFTEGTNGLSVDCDYNTDLFDETTIHRWFDRYEVLLESIVSKPVEVLDAMPVLPEGERRELLALGSSSETEYPSRTVAEWFEDRAGMNPEGCAVVCEGTELTYGELNRRANQLAQHLRTLGIGPNDLVGLMVERSMDMMIALLGVMKSGGAYVPLDPSFPADRLNYMVENSRMRALVTHRDLDRLLSVKPSAIVRLDTDSPALAQYGTQNLPPAGGSPNRLAYVLYTSGSTGKPKGVEIIHPALVNFLDSMRREPGFTSADTVLAVTTLSFDIAGLELYLPLVTGGTLVIASREEAQDPVRLMERMRECRCTMMQATPSTWRGLIQVGWNGSPGLKILCGGEAFPRDLAEDLLPRCAELWNMYGPTETTIWSTVHRIVDMGGPIAIGHPIANTQVYVLDAHRGLVPRGVIGELYIGGKGVARGYLHRPDLTEERFIPNPFAPTDRCYRTGDLARWLPDGTLECLGRIDGQVKVRGYRIELGEIETVLAQHSGIRQAVASAYEASPGNKTLVAYFESRDGMSLAINDLRTHLKKSLPDYMVPSIFIQMDKLPLTPNGKIDRKALPAPAESRSDTATKHVPPRDLVEQVLSRIWSNVLKVKDVGVQDNFFELGGHSILAVRLIIEIEKIYGKRLPLATLIQAPTIERLAQIIQKEKWTPPWFSLVPIRGGGARPPLFLFHSHGGNVLEYYPLAELLDSDQPVYALQTRGLDGRIVANQSIEDMVREYLKEIRSFQPEGPYYLAGFCFGGLAALEAARQLAEAGEPVALVGMIQTMYPIADVFPGMSPIAQWWYRIKKRAALEWESFSYRGTGHMAERVKRVVDVLGAKTAIMFDRLIRNDGTNTDYASRSMPYILERLAMEHENAYQGYKPSPYAGNVILFRVQYQLPAFSHDRSLGWKNLLGTNLQVCDMPGHQQNLLRSPHVQVLARELMSHLRQTQAFWAEKTSKPQAV